MPEIVIANSRDASSQYREFVVADVCGNGRAPWTKDLAPQNLGPVDLYGGKVARLLVNGWHFAQVYADQLTPEGNLVEGYSDWAERGWAASMHQATPGRAGKRPLYVLWDGELRDPVEAWQQIYFPMYRDLVKVTQSFERLRALSKSHSIVLVDDSFSSPVTQLLRAGTQPLTHALIIKAMLEHDVEVTAEQAMGGAGEKPRLAA